MKCSRCQLEIEDRLTCLSHMKKCKQMRNIRTVICSICKNEFSSSHISRHVKKCSRKMQKQYDLRKRIEFEHRQSLIDAREEVASFQYSAQKPVCQTCKSELMVQHCKQHYYFTCADGHGIIHNCSKYQKQSPLSRSPDISTSCAQQKTTIFKQLAKKKKKNNIQRVIQQTHYSFISQYRYSKTFPQTISTDIKPQSDAFAKMILENRLHEQFLPLRIAQSTGKGKGVFSTATIPKNTLICSYLGILATNYDIVTGNSLFSLGWVTNQHEILELLVIPHKYTNMARFINSSQNKKANCQPIITLIQAEQQYQFCIFLYSTSIIKPDQQLLYPYGPQHSLII